MRYKLIKNKRFDSFHKIKALLLGLNRVGRIPLKKFFFFLSILNKKTYTNFNKLLYIKLRNIVYTKSHPRTTSLYFNSFFIRAYRKRVDTFLTMFNINALEYIKRNKTPPKRLVVYSFIKSFKTSTRFFEGRNTFFYLEKIVHFFFQRMEQLTDTRRQIFEIKEKHIVILTSFLTSVGLHRILSYNSSKSKLKKFLLKKSKTFLHSITIKALYLFFYYEIREEFFMPGRKAFVDFFVGALKIFFNLVKLNSNLNVSYPKLKHLLKIKRDRFASSDTTSIDLYRKLIGLIQKKGNKAKATKILDSALFLVRKELKVPNKQILLRLFNKLKISVEPRVIKVRRRLHDVPFPVKYERKTFLIVKWLLKSVSKDKRKQSIVLKLKRHIIKVITGPNSLPYKTKRYFIHKTIENRSNFHYRWW